MTFHIKKSRDYAHYNRSLGSYVSSKKDYQEKMSRAGCEPYRPQDVKRAGRKHYEPTKWARDIARTGSEQFRTEGKVSGAVMKELVEKGNMKPTPEQIKNRTTGGSYASNE